MAYHLKLDESVPEGLKRVVSEEIDAAVAQLTGQGEAGRDDAIHEARKSVKKIRGVLRLMQPELGGVFRLENTRLQRVGRQLSEFRDAGAIIETFDALKEKYRGDLGRHTLASVRRGLLARKEQAERSAGIERVLDKMAGELRRSGKRLRKWPLQTDGFQAIAPGLQKTFQRGRKALARARQAPTPQNYHTWRKRTKDHWYHIRLLENLWTDVMQAYEKSLKELETWLGEDHNLVVLREKILAERDFYGKARDITLLMDLMDRYQRELRDNAMSLGERVYDVSPRQFTRRMKRLWEAWQAQPKGLAAAPKGAAAS
jgi:CHAD domain-containing protein